ncbi:MAG: hypothetical protein F4Z87_06875 [Gammaproteobacteria bacterium]|nr:hypothetical protein [Gammaproteobacteria bacterium]MYE30798.1 hypothetical protein [Gammaproteobacteria bacterium]
MQKILTAILLIGILWAAGTSAQQLSDQQEEQIDCADILPTRDLLREQCLSESIAFVRGVYDGHRITVMFNDLPEVSCPPLNIPMSNFTANLLEWVVLNRPELMDEPARSVLLIALMALYPCADSNQ